MNLLQETLEAIAKSGHSVEDIAFIGSADAEYRCSWDEFSELANVEYDNGFGGAEVASDLIVRFRDGRRMWRGEYDGSEWWEYDAIDDIDYTKPGKPIKKIIGGLWAELDEMNRAHE